MVGGFFELLDFGVVWRFRYALLQGLGSTLMISAVGFVGGTLLGTLAAISASSRSALIRVPVRGAVEFLRSTPLLMQAIWMHFALPMMLGFSLTPTVSALIALTLNVAAYNSEVIRAGINGVPAGQAEAALALGLPVPLIWRKVVLPQALRIVLPPLTSAAISTVKASAILSILAIDDLMRVAMRINGFVFRPVELYTAAALLYFLVGIAIAGLGRLTEKRLEVEGR